MTQPHHPMDHLDAATDMLHAHNAAVDDRRAAEAAEHYAEQHDAKRALAEQADEGELDGLDELA